MQVYIKNLGGGKGEAWVEAFDNNPDVCEWQVTCLAKLMLMPDGECLIDTINTKPQHRRQGYATELVRYLQQHFKFVAPMGVTKEGQPFWDALGMVDALGLEE